jgi:hypothetical protein
MQSGRRFMDMRAVRKRRRSRRSDKRLRENEAMGASHNDFEQHFSSLSDAALLEIKRADLVPAAQTVYDDELERRGLEADLSEQEPQATMVTSSGGEQLVNVVEFESAEDAGRAQEQLKKNGIPAYIAVAVPEAFARQAVSLLDPGVSEEELAALAESSAPPDQG